MNIDHVLRGIREHRQHGNRSLVAIDGFGGAGKSTLAGQLAAALGNANVVSPSTAKERGQARDAGNENENRWDAWSHNDTVYLETHRPDLIADAIVTND